MIKLRYMKLFFIILFILTSSVSSLLSESRFDQKRREFFKEDIPVEKKEAKPLFEILSLHKGVIQQELYDPSSGTSQTPCIELKFKINRGGLYRTPHCFVYLYNADKNPVLRLERMFTKEITLSKEINPLVHTFKGKRTYILQFDYPPEILFKYYLAVIGNAGIMTVEVEPGNISWDEFDFEEKKKFKKIKPPQN